MKRHLGKTSRFVLKLLVSVSLLVFLIRKLSVGELKELLVSMDPAAFGAAAAVFLASNILGSIQWHLLLKSSGIELPFHKTFRIYFVGLFFNNFLPANVGGDAVKIYDVSRVGSSLYQVLAVTVLDRLLGIFGLCLLASAAVLTMLSLDPSGSLILYLVIFLGCMVPAFSFYMFKPLGRLLRRTALKIRPLSLDRRITAVLDGLGEFKSRKAFIARLVLLSLVIQTLRVSTHILVGKALGVTLDATTLVAFFVFVPLLGLAMIPPVTINGLGVREGLGMVLFSGVGIAKADAFVMEFLTYFISVAVSFLGWLFFIARRAENESASLETIRGG